MFPERREQGPRVPFQDKPQTLGSPPSSATQCTRQPLDGRPKLYHGVGMTTTVPSSEHWRLHHVHLFEAAH